MINPELSRGHIFVRSLIARAASGSDGRAIEHARTRFGERVGFVTKAVVDAGGIGSGTWGSALAIPEVAEFFGTVEQASVVGRAGLREVALNVRTVTVAARPTVYWVGAPLRSRCRAWHSRATRSRR